MKMINDFIGGGQVFLHKIRMFAQVLEKTIFWALIAAVLGTLMLSKSAIMEADWFGFLSYQKADLTIKSDAAFNEIRPLIGNQPNLNTKINAQTHSKSLTRAIIYTDVAPKLVMQSSTFIKANNSVLALLKYMALLAIALFVLGTMIVFVVWSYFGKGLSAEKRKKGSSVILTATQVRSTLRSLKKASDLMIGKMPLVKDMETRHMLVTGSTGSGKTNLLHNLLPQIKKRKQPAIVIDQTGEMIAKYYDPKRGDIIFNPFDARSHAWDFWSDCAQLYMLEHFANILIGFNNRQNARQTNDFWEEASQTIFVALTKKMQNENDLSLRKLLHILSKSDRQTLYDMLSDTDAGKYFAKDNAKTVASINSVLMANIKPLRFLSEMDTKQKFTIEQYLKNISTGNSESWLFLSACPSARNLTLPLTSCLLELIVSKIMNQAQAQNQQKIWFIIDELASLGRMPSLNILMQEGRKYGACVVSGMQSISQLYAYYGEADASNLIGLFRTKFAFGSDDPKMADLYGKLFGISTVISQQKNTSFGANEFRDGVSYNEKHDNLPLVSYQDLTKLQMGECFVLLPESDVRVARLEVPLATNRDENSWFVENTKSTFLNNSKSSALVSELAKTPEQISENSAVFFETDIPASAQIEEKTSLSAKEFDFVN